MKALIISDSHGKNNNIEKLLRKVSPLDLIIHLGDLEGSEGHLREISPCPIEMVCGNNDFFTELDREKVIEFGDYRIFITHGHYYGVACSGERVKEAARSFMCNIVMYGHTHRPEIDLSTDIVAVNPGSISYPRQENHKPSYVIMEIDRFGEIHFTLNYM